MADTDRIIVSRLYKLYNPFRSLELKGLTCVDMLDGIPASSYSPEPRRTSKGKRWHYGRVKFFVEQLRKGVKLDPIDVDNYCCGYVVTGQPLVLDGHHRLAAVILAKKRYIDIYYSGLVDTLDYLKGKRRNPPAF